MLSDGVQQETRIESERVHGEKVGMIVLLDVEKDDVREQVNQMYCNCE